DEDLQSRFYHPAKRSRLWPAQRRERRQRNGGHSDCAQRRPGERRGVYPRIAHHSRPPKTSDANRRASMKDIKPNRRILIVDDNESIHSDFHHILCPDDFDQTTVNEMEAVLFEETAQPEQPNGFELNSAFQGKEG